MRRQLLLRRVGRHLESPAILGFEIGDHEDVIDFRVDG